MDDQAVVRKSINSKRSDQSADSQSSRSSVRDGSISDNNRSEVPSPGWSNNARKSLGHSARVYQVSPNLTVPTRTANQFSGRTLKTFNAAVPQGPTTSGRASKTPQKLPSVTFKQTYQSPVGGSARITSHNVGPSPRSSVNTSASLMRASESMQIKSYASKTIKPLWQILDEQREETLKRYKRDRQGNRLPSRRIAPGTRGQGSGPEGDIFRISINDPNYSPSLIGPGFRLRMDGKIEDSDDDELNRYKPQAKLLVHRKVADHKVQIAVKTHAARKVRSVDTSSSSDSDHGSDEDEPSSPELSAEEEDELDSDQYEPPGDVDMREHGSESPDLVVIEPRSLITAPLPQIDTQEETKLTITAEPSTELVSAFESLSLATARMHKTKQLPFLVRNVRQGFLHRCRELLLPIYSNGEDICLQVQYENTGGYVYLTELNEWRCPMCDLLGSIPTREMLSSHLRWDHGEVYHEWQKIEDSQVKGLAILSEDLSSHIHRSAWKLQLVIPEVHEELNHGISYSVQVESKPISLQGNEGHREVEPVPTGLQEKERTNHQSSPPLALQTPPSVPASIHLVAPSPLRIKSEPPILVMKQERQGAASVTSTRTTSVVTSTLRSHSAAATTTTSASTSTSRRRSLDPRYPTPPPPDNSLGPAAQWPYLPAKSDYGGPTIYYSCRPLGPCLFDLLGTLPMEPFGVLDWEVLDREDEIYESDNVKEEYKVMHALWARWIFLNRNKFIDNHLKGAKSFIDDYWKIIHKAAGWDALRYFLFILLANQYLTGHEIAQTLRHYESHTGMEFWYE